MSSAVGANVARGDVPLPALVLREELLAHNLEVMSAYSRAHGFELAPHGKTTMAPQLFTRQLEAGAWGITVANVSQAKVARRAGAGRILIANEVIGERDVAWLAEELAAGEVELYCLVDGERGVGLLDARLAQAGGPSVGGRLGVLVELGFAGGRTGARSRDEAMRVADAVGSSARLVLRGVEGYEGGVGSDRTPDSLAAVDRYLDEIRQLTVELASQHAFGGNGPVIVSAGGSKYFDRVADVLRPGPRYDGLEVVLVVRSGCYLCHDHGIYARDSPLAGPSTGSRGISADDQLGGDAVLAAAMELWAEVVSMPEPGLAILGCGRRDASFDAGLPTPLHLANDGPAIVPMLGAELFRLDDQHGYLRLAEGGSELEVGDRIGFGLSHPCTAFDKWREVLLVDEGYNVIECIATYFH